MSKTKSIEFRDWHYSCRISQNNDGEITLTLREHCHRTDLVINRIVLGPNSYNPTTLLASELWQLFSANGKLTDGVEGGSK
jgi:hypothetical protein